MIFKKVGDSRPYPQHGMTHADWGGIPPQQVRLDTLITTQKTLNLETLLAEDSTFYGDLFPHVVKWGGELYLEDGVHRALRNALHCRAVMYARVLDLDSISPALFPGAYKPTRIQKMPRTDARSIRSAALYVAIQPAKPLGSDLQVCLLHRRLLRQRLLGVQTNRVTFGIETCTQTHLNKTDSIQNLALTGFLIRCILGATGA